MSKKTKRAYKFRFYPTDEQKSMLAQTFGCVRFVYNWGLSNRKTAYFQRRTLVKVDRWYPSSKTCHACKHVLDSLTLDIREWVCPACGVVHDRDTNAALNILAENIRNALDVTSAICYTTP